MDKLGLLSSPQFSFVHWYVQLGKLPHGDFLTFHTILDICNYSKNTHRFDL